MLPLGDWVIHEPTRLSMKQRWRLEQVHQTWTFAAPPAPSGQGINHKRDWYNWHSLELQWILDPLLEVLQVLQHLLHDQALDHITDLLLAKRRIRGDLDCFEARPRVDLFAHVVSFLVGILLNIVGWLLLLNLRTSVEMLG